MLGQLNVLETVSRRQSGVKFVWKKREFGHMNASWVISLGLRTKGWSLACYMVWKSSLPLSIAFLVPRHHLPQDFYIFLPFISAVSPHKPPYTAFAFCPLPNPTISLSCARGSLWPDLTITECLCMPILLSSFNICCLWVIREHLWIQKNIFNGTCTEWVRTNFHYLLSL